ncbi:MAG TPA: molybdopterin cofactor-binding domain-containing protein [Bryobacteraceae bacterium]|jgi:nicotinate dehydrogenase subunit B|nr:molybdopterin cofactor-binding domain-containing protein [Bryobacteraceae bacterium]
MTPDARAALNRRSFLQSAGVLIVGFRMAGGNAAQAQFGQAPLPGAPPMDQVDSWIAIAADGSITAYSGKEELGQGISTAQQQLVAEELSVPFDRVKLIYCDTALTPDQAYTSGSQSHPANFNHANLAQAGATAREALYKMASQRLGVPVDQLTAVNGVISVRGDTSKRVSYGQLVGGKKLSVKLDKSAKRKNPREWTVLGKPIGRPDMPLMATGHFEYVHNVRLPGMLHGRVVRPPAVGATLISVDESSVKDMPGVVKVVTRKNFVGVVAEKPWQAIQAAEKLKVSWTPGAGLPKQSEFYEHLRQQPSRDLKLLDSKDTQQALAKAATVHKSTYYHPYQMHGSVGSSCAVADVQSDKAIIYSPTQGVWYQKTASAMITGLKPENVHVIFRRGSGCYGLNGADTVTYDAVVLSQAVGKPVRVQLSRKDEMAWENYGNAWVIEERAGLDAKGNIIAWEHESWTPGMGNRPGPSTPGNVITGMLIGYQPAPFTPGPAEEPKRYSNSSNGIPSYMMGNIDGVAGGAGTVKSESVIVHNVLSPFWTGPLRSPARLQNTFAHESFMDELASSIKADPVEFRVRHLRDPRLIGVLEAAARAAKWEPRPSPHPTNPKSGVVTGRGVACVAYEGDNGYTGIVVDVEVNQDTGKVVVKNIWAGIDVGPVSNPNGLRNQAEGGALQGMSRALGEQVTWDDHKVTSVDWRTYHSLPLGIEIPKIECVLMNRPDDEATGAGETSITVMAAAIGNAIFDATGARLRQIPLTAERVKEALNARA